MSSQQIPPTLHQIKQKDRGWYSVSVTSVRRLMTLVGLIVAIVAAVLAYDRWMIYTLEDRALAAIEDATAIAEQLRASDRFDQIYRDHKAAWDQLEEARQAFEDKNFESALEKGKSCVNLLRSILASLSQGSIRVMSVQGNVEFRRGDRGNWSRLRPHDTLDAGDWVKTATDGTAQLKIGDGSVFTLRQSTMVHLNETEATDLAFGRVELNTSDQSSTVSTPKSTATVRSDSEALVSFDRDKGAGRFAAFEGSLQVESKAGGQAVEVGAMQQIEQFGDQFSDLRDLPFAPVPLGPTNDRAFDLDTDKEVVLSWQPVDRAREYALQISTTRLFAASLIDDVRTKTSARLGIQGEGNFYWQVAALDAQGTTGPWSEARAFRVASLSTIGEVNDRVPPALEIVDTETLGNLVIINGKTESGATVTINGEAVVLRPDGSFSKTIQMMQAGWSMLEIVATDAWNNESIQRTQVFIDAV